MSITPLSRSPNPLLKNLLRLLDELPMQVDSIRVHATRGIVLTEDELRGLLVVHVHQTSMFLALF